MAEHRRMAARGTSIGSTLIVGALASYMLAPPTAARERAERGDHGGAASLHARSEMQQTDGGVELDSNQDKDSETSEITFSGYRSLPNGGGILFVEMTASVSVEVKRAGQVIEYRMVGARVPLKNNRHPLLMRDFSATVVSSVLVPEKARRGGKPAVKLIVTLRSPVEPAHRMVPRGKGAALEIEFPPPKS